MSLNQDGTVNNGANPAKAGSYVTLYGTGQGLVEPRYYGLFEKTNGRY